MQLLEVLAKVGPVNPGFIAVEVLAEAAKTHPRTAVACLAALLDVRVERLGHDDVVDGSSDFAELALASGDAEAARSARDLINVLEARGYTGYRDLLAA